MIADQDRARFGRHHRSPWLYRGWRTAPSMDRGRRRRPARVGRGMRRFGVDLHQLDAVAVGVGDPELEVVVQPPGRLAVDGQAALAEFAYRGVDIVDEQAEMVVAGVASGLRTDFLGAGE